MKKLGVLFLTMAMLSGSTIAEYAGSPFLAGNTSANYDNYNNSVEDANYVYNTGTTRFVHKTDKKTGKSSVIAEISPNEMCIKNDIIYMMGYLNEKDRLLSLNTKTKAVKVLSNDSSISELTLDGDYLYYKCDEIKNNEYVSSQIVKMHLTTLKTSTVYKIPKEASLNSIQVFGDSVYFLDTESKKVMLLSQKTGEISVVLEDCGWSSIIHNGNIYYSQDNAEGGSEVYVQKLGSKKSTRKVLLKDLLGAPPLVFSEKYIFYTAFSEKSMGNVIWRMNYDGTKKQQISKNIVDISGITIAGNYIFFDSMDPNSNRVLRVRVSLDGKTEKILD